MNNTPILSLCIPTNGAVHWILPTLEHIYEQDCDTDLYEVIITDNGSGNELSKIIKDLNYPNLTYLKTSDKGFMNQITCFKQAKGLFIRMLNHRSILIPGTLRRWIELIQKYKEEKPIIYFSGGVFKELVTDCSNFEEFVKNLSYYSSWSAGISFWNTDKSQLDVIKYDSMFPTTSILFEIRQQSKYIIWNEKYQEMQDETGKGGYNIYKTFAVSYLDILNDLRIRNRISISTFILVKQDLLGFLCNWYHILSSKKNKYTFDTTDMDSYLKVYYSRFDIWMIKFKANLLFLKSIKRVIKTIIKSVLK